MDSVKKVLIGYIEPKALAIAVNAIGENGLTQRIRTIGYLWQISRSLSRTPCYRFGMRHCPMVFLSYLGSVETAWLTETLRIMDRKESRVRGVLKQNLTISLCHERFQNEPSTTAAQRSEEARLYAILDTEYKNANLKEFRDQRMFHLDLSEALSDNAGTGNVEKITHHIMDWYRYVGTVAFGVEPVWTTQAARVGKQIAKEFRSMMTAKQRADAVKEDNRIERHYRKIGQPRPVDD